jgi:hypothetical protein
LQTHNDKKTPHPQNTKRYARDVSAPPGDALTYVADAAPRRAYAHLLALGARDGLSEGSRQSRVYGGAANEVDEIGAVFSLFFAACCVTSRRPNTNTKQPT